MDHVISYQDVFRHCENDAEATRLLEGALAAMSIPTLAGHLPMRASEDFGRFGDNAKAAMLLLGAGRDCPALHDPDYDFPDALIGTGASIFIQCLRSQLY